jgi:ribosomal-protein-alanine N-acetyltransferase
MPDVTLAQVVASDGPALIAANLASRSLHHPWAHPCTDQPAFDSWIAGVQTPATRAFIARAAAGEITGAITFSQIAFGNFCSAYLGFYAMAAFAGQGYMKAALLLAIAHAFGPLGLHRLEANIQPENTRSIALIRGLGFSREGFSPAYLRIGGAWRDHERWALIKPDETDFPA